MPEKLNELYESNPLPVTFEIISSNCESLSSDTLAVPKLTL